MSEQAQTGTMTPATSSIESAVGAAHDEPLFEHTESQDTGDQMTTDEDASDELTDNQEGRTTFRLKVNGEVGEFTEQEVIALAQKQLAGELRLESAKKASEELKKQEGEIKKQRMEMETMQHNMVQFFNGFSGSIDQIENNWDVLRSRFPNTPPLEKVVEAYIDRWQNIQNMTPEQKAQYLIERERAKIQAEMAEKENKITQAQAQYLRAQFVEMLHRELPGAIDAVGLPKTEYVVERMSQVWAQAIENGMRPTAQQVAEFVKKKLVEENYRLLEQVGDDDVDKLPQSLLDKVNRKNVERVRQSQPKKRANPEAIMPKKSNGIIGMREWRQMYK